MEHPGAKTLHEAVRNQNVEAVRFFLNHGADGNEKENDPHGCTPLHLAVYSGNQEILKMLVDAKVDVNVKNNQGLTPFFYALCDFGRLDLAKILVYAGADASTESPIYGGTILHLAVKYNELELIEYLISQRNVDVNLTDRYGYTALHCLACCNDASILGVAEILLKNGADINAVDHWGRKPLGLLIRNRSKDMIRQIFELVLMYHQDKSHAEPPIELDTSGKKENREDELEDEKPDEAEKEPSNIDKVILCLFKEIKDENAMKLQDETRERRCEKLEEMVEKIRKEYHKKTNLYFILVLVLSYILLFENFFYKQWKIH